MTENQCPICGGNIVPVRDELACNSSMCSYKPAKEEKIEEPVEAPVEEVVEEALVEEVEEIEEEEESSDEEAYFDALPVKELRKLCKEANLSTKGRKADLVARLIE